MRYIVLDLETTGLDVDNNHAIEFGYALYDSSQDTPLVVCSELLTQAVEITEEITHITGITQQMMEEFGVPPIQSYCKFLTLCASSNISFFAGHNALAFDKPFLTNELARVSLRLPELPWLDTKIDLPLDYKPKSSSLTYMAADHGFINPFAHRALFDSLTCGVLISKYDIDQMFDSIKFPLVELRALVGYDDRDKAKARGFYWDGERKYWVKKVRSCFLSSEMNDEFKVIEVR